MMAKPIRALELHYPMIHFVIKYDKTTLYLSVNVLSTKVLIEVTILISHWRRDRHFMWSCSCLAVCRAKAVLSFHSFFKTLRICHFWVPPGLCIKTRLSAQPLIWKWFFILMQLKLIFTRKVVWALGLILKVRVFGTRKWPIGPSPDTKPTTSLS